MMGEGKVLKLGDRTDLRQPANTRHDDWVRRFKSRQADERAPSDMAIVTLNWWEVEIAAQVGLQRNIEGIKNRGDHKVEGISRGGGWDGNIMGAMAEMVLSKFFNVYWTGKGNYGGADVGATYEVRSKDYHGAGLRMHKSDLKKKDSPFFLITGLNGVHVIHGWIYPVDGIKEEWFGDHAKTGKPFYQVPQSELKSPWMKPFRITHESELRDADRSPPAPQSPGDYGYQHFPA